MVDPRRSQTGWRKVVAAIYDGLAIGFQRHLPGAVGLVAKGVPICGLLAFARFVLHADWPPSLVLGGLGAAGGWIGKHWP